MPRPTGLPKSGGRRKGTPNHATAAREAAIEASGLSPLDFMLAVMRDEHGEPAMRLDAAKAAAPYVHPRLASVDLGNRDDKPFEIKTEEREKLKQRARAAIAAAFAELPKPDEVDETARPLLTASMSGGVAAPANAGDMRTFVDPALEVETLPVEASMPLSAAHGSEHEKGALEWLHQHGYDGRGQRISRGY